MKKTDKKIEKKLVAALNKVCKIALDEVEGFEWLTHLVNYDDFPKSLLVVCVFNSSDSLAQALSAKQAHWLCEIVKQELAAIDIMLLDIVKHVQFETEESFQIENNSQSNKRFKRKLH